jgi:hypothetical protein
MAISSSGGDEVAMARAMIMALKRLAQQWYACRKEASGHGNSFSEE